MAGNADILTGRWDGTSGLQDLPGGNINITPFMGRLGTHSNVPLIGYKSGDVTPKRIKRGMMRSTVGETVTFQFMYNPPEVNYSYDINEGMLSADALAQDPAGLQGVPNLVGGSSISFMLYFDRSIEVAAGRRMGGPSNRPGDIGVMHDLAVYERLVGEVGSGTVVSQPVKVYFTRGPKAGPGLNFRGLITGTHIVFKQFSQEMIPTRMEMAITMRRLYVPGSDLSAAQAEAKTATQKKQVAVAAAKDANLNPQTKKPQAPQDPVYNYGPTGAIIGVSSDGGRTWGGVAPES